MSDQPNQGNSEKTTSVNATKAVRISTKEDLQTLAALEMYLSEPDPNYVRELVLLGGGSAAKA